MTDDALTPAAELASAAFDGEITSHERAQVEASAELSAQVASFVQIRAQISDVAVPQSARDNAVAAALAVFDELNALASDEQALAGAGQTGSTGSPKVVSLHERRQRQLRWLTGAAAAAIVVVVAAGVINPGSDSKSSSTQSLDAAVQSSQSKSANASEIGAPTAGATADSSVGPDAATSATIGVVAGPAVVTPWALAPSFATSAEMAAYAIDPAFGQPSTASNQPPTTALSTALSAAPSAADRATEYNTSCLANVAGPFAAVVFQGQQVLAIRDDKAKSVSVVNPVTCAVVTTIALP